jgi:hypothetical protein
LLLDQYLTFIPQHEFVHQQWLRGRFPLWNPYLCCGMPNLASTQGALLFPINLLLLSLDPFYAAGPAAFLKLFLAGLFTMLYLRLLGASDAAAFLSGLVFSLCGFMIVWLGHPHVNCAMWLPLLLYFIEKTFRCGAGNLFVRSHLRLWIGFAITYGFMLLGGHSPTAIHITIGIFIYFLFRLAGGQRDQPFRRTELLIGSLTFGFFLAAAQMLPYLEYYGQSSSGLASDEQQRWSSHLPPVTLIQFLLPCFSGSPVKGFGDLRELLGLGTLSNFNERTAYVGILPLLFALCAVVSRRCKFTVFYSCVAVASLLVVYGVPPLPAIVRALPVLCDVNHTRLLLFTAFSLAVLAGLGWDVFEKMENRRRMLWIVTAFWLVAGLGLVSFGCLVRSKLDGLDAGYRTFLLKQFFPPAVGLVVSCAVMLRPARWGRWGCRAVCFGWTAVDLLCFGMGYNPAIPRDLYYPATPAIVWLKQDPSVFRVLGGGPALVPNTAAIFGLSDARGCDYMSVRRYEELITGNAADFFFYRNVTCLPDSFPLLNVKYLLSPEPLPRDLQGLELVYSNGMGIYRNPKWQKRALVVFDYEVDPDPASVLARVRSRTFDPGRLLLLEEEPEGTVAREEARTATPSPGSSARITSYEPDEVRIEASLSRPGFLLLLDTWFPGWLATVNGRPTRICRADYNFRAVSLLAGRSTVCFSYRPASWRNGLAFSLAAVLVLGAVWFWQQKKSSSMQSPDPAAEGRDLGASALPKGR